MNATEIINMITTVGFPVVVCLICFWYINNQAIRHREETEKMANALNNNTLVMQKLIDKLENNYG